MDNSTDEHLKNACPSIRYRLYKEVLNQPSSTGAMEAIQNQILEDPAVKAVIGWQQPDGWLGSTFHGGQSMEARIRLLCEKGVESRHPVLSKALEALGGVPPDRLERGIGKAGKILDEMGLGGAQMIRATVLAYAGIENEPCVKVQIELALAGFRATATVGDVAKLAEVYRGKPVLRPGVLWPSIYHLRLLAFTHGWRTPQNQMAMAEGIHTLVRMSPLPDFHARYKSQLIACASFCMNDFKPDLASLDDAGWMMWFHRMELLARLGIIHRVPELMEQVIALKDMLSAGNGKFIRSMAHAYFKQWGAYTGLMLEANWRAARRRIYDLTFRSLLILYYADRQAA